MIFNKKIKFNRFEFAGSFGDIGTDLPLLLAVTTAASLSFSTVFLCFGVLQIIAGFYYKIPMPLQPLKAMSVIVIANQLPMNYLFGAGLVIAVIMLIFAQTGLLMQLEKMIKHHIVRGLQMGLGFSLMKLSFTKYIFTQGSGGVIFSFVCLFLYILMRKNKTMPAGIIIITLGMIYGINILPSQNELSYQFNLHLPQIYIPTSEDLWQGFILLVIPQIPLSLTNSVIATHKTVNDLFPDSKITIKKIGTSYGLFNLVPPFIGGIPVCHGCGGLVGHYGFGGRTGGSVIYYGLLYALMGIFLSGHKNLISSIFPLPVLGAILVVEAFLLILLAKDIWFEKKNLIITFVVAVCCVSFKQGYLYGLIVGLILDKILNNKKTISHGEDMV